MNAPGTRSISRSEEYPVSRDYAALLSEGYKLIAVYSGSLWTNYNDSDPGITILQNLCYALTELGNKADLPVASILTQENEKIKIKDHFHSPDQIFPTNPVTFTDFSKLLLSEVPELKQAYFRRAALTSSVQCFAEVKPEYVSQVASDLLFTNRVEEQAKLILVRHENISQVFARPVLLSPVLMQLSGSVILSKDVPAEKTISAVIYSINCYLSPYPGYQNYAKLVSNGENLADLLEGPWLSSGYIPDEDIAEKRVMVKISEMNGCLTIPGVDEAALKTFVMEGSDAKATDHQEISFDEAPYVSSESFNNVSFIQNGKQVKGYDKNKLNYYLSQLIPVQQPGDLADLIPKGDYREIETYYSIQNSFSSLYQLVGKGPVDVAHQAKVRQLKAYLFLFEQLMGDYLAQLRNVPKLFSFESGRTDFQLTTATYFTQPLYNVPGIDRVLAGVKDTRDQGDKTSADRDWKIYQQDSSNPYVTVLKTKATSAENDLDRKLRAMEHLLARCGKKYDHLPLHFANPNYGIDRIAEIEYVKQTLRNLPLLTGNPVRTYFRNHTDTTLASGVELNLENELGLKSFYRGIVEAIEQGLEHEKTIEIIYYGEPGTREMIFPRMTRDWATRTPAAKTNWVEVWCSQEILLSFPCLKKLSVMSVSQAKTFLQPFMANLKTLATEYSGLLLVDFARLIDLLSFRWILKSTDGRALYTSSLLPFDRLQKRVSLIESQQSFEIKEITPDSNYEIGVRTNRHRYVVCDNIRSMSNATVILERLKSLKGDASDAITIQLTDKTGNRSCLLAPLTGCVFVFLPQWVTAFQSASYQELIQTRLISLGPASAITDVQFLKLEDYEKLSALYDMWMKGLNQLYDGQKPDADAKSAAVDLALMISNERDNNG